MRLSLNPLPWKIVVVVDVRVLESTFLKTGFGSGTDYQPADNKEPSLAVNGAPRATQGCRSGCSEV